MTTASWNSETTAVATIAADGLATAEGPGQSVITATVGSISGQATLTVLTPSVTITSIDVQPPPGALGPGKQEAVQGHRNFERQQHARRDQPGGVEFG